MKYLLLISGLLIFSLSMSFRDQKKEDTIKVTETAIQFNNEPAFALRCQPKNLEQIFNKARFEPGVPNSVYFWDSLGIMGFVPHNDSLLSSFEICFSESGYFETSQFYQGKVQILNHSIDKETRRLEYVKFYADKIKDTFDFMPQFKIGNHLVIAEFEEENGKIIGLAISE